MGRKEDRKYEKLHELVLLLLDHPEGLTKAEIGRRLGVNRSTAGRYLDDLSLPSGVSAPVYEVSPGRFTIDRDLYRFEISLNLHEALALFLAARLLTTRTDKHYPEAAAALRKLAEKTTRLAPPISLHLKRAARVLEGPHRPKQDAFLEVLRTLTQAWALGRKVELTHEMEDGQTFSYRFAPYFIEPYAVGRTMHVIGHREPPGAIRTFKIERIRTIRLLEEPYALPADFDPSDYLKDAWGIWTAEGRVETVRLRFRPGVARRVEETLWHHTQQITRQPDGSVIWEAQIADWREMLPWIRGWGADCEALAPEGLRKRLEREAARMAGLYRVADVSGKFYYAHSRPDVSEDEWQLLKDHLQNTADLAVRMGEPLGIAELVRVAALLHDLGKYSDLFQARLRGGRRRVDHATAGAREIARMFADTPQKVLAELISFAIAGHHTGLPDYGSPGDLGEEGTLLARREKKRLEDYSAYKQELDLSDIRLPNPKIKPVRFRFGEREQTFPDFSISFLARMLFSTLVDADWLETERFMEGEKPRGQHASIAELAEQFNQFLQRFENPSTPINRKRTETLHACIHKAENQPGFFKLTVPTGGGKTYASMAFALNHAIRHGLRRVIYVIPFTSIIEQNADKFREALGPLGAENVLEHHSNFDWSKAEEADDETNQVVKKLKLAAENWDVPIVVTTNVQFFESLFANKKRAARKLHNIARSVIIFDEAQNLPREYLQPSLMAVQELVQNYGCTAVFCTATQPALEQFFPQDIAFTELAPNPPELYAFYRRVKIRNLGELTDEALLDCLNSHEQALCIVNTRRHARGLFNGLRGEGNFHLSTLMCPAHRRQVLAEIRARLADGRTCRVVSTQVLEAGIDVDFPVGYRALAGLDSVIQAAGRVNREMKREHGEVFVFTPQTPFIKRTPAFIQQTGAVARAVFREHAQAPDSLEAVAAYYNMLYTLQSDESFDAYGILTHLQIRGDKPAFEFQKVAEKFKLIRENTVSIFIPYDDEARDMLGRLPHVKYPVTLLRKLQPYIVNIYEREFERLQAQGVIWTLGEHYHVLDEERMPEFYSPDTGLRLVEDEGGAGIFFDG